MKKRRTEQRTPHYGQILTTRHTIRSVIDDIAYEVGYHTALLIALGNEDRDYLLRLYAVCSELHYLGSLIYLSKDGSRILRSEDYDKMHGRNGDSCTADDIEERMKAGKGFSKLPQSCYEEAFTGFLESEDEVLRHIERYNKSSKEKIGIDQKMFECIIRCRSVIAPVCSRMMAMIEERFFIGEYACVFDYVIRHKGDLPMPEYRDEGSWIPNNYEDFRMTNAFFREYNKDPYKMRRATKWQGIRKRTLR